MVKGKTVLYCAVTCRTIRLCALLCKVAMWRMKVAPFSPATQWGVRKQEGEQVGPASSAGITCSKGGVPPGRAPSLPGSTRQVMRGAMITIAGRPAEKQPIAQRQHGISLVWGEPQPKWGHCGPRHGRREEGAAHVHPGYCSGHRPPSATAGPQGIADPCASLSGGPAERGRQEGKSGGSVGPAPPRPYLPRVFSGNEVGHPRARQAVGKVTQSITERAAQRVRRGPLPDATSEGHGCCGSFCGMRTPWQRQRAPN